MATFADRLRSLLRWPPLPLACNEPAHPFDLAHGVDTSGLFYADRLPTGHAHDSHSEGYYATAPSLFYGAMAQWQAALGPGAHVEDYTFVDLGCGKGRVVLMASGYPFRAVRGIELNPALARVARRNVRLWARSGRAVCRDVQAVRNDVLGTELEGLLEAGGAVVLFLFNSFGAEVVGPLMAKLAEAARHRMRAPIDLIYVHPEQDRLVAATPGIELLRHAEVAFSYEDARADLFGVTSDVCSVYRLGGCGGVAQSGEMGAE